MYVLVTLTEAVRIPANKVHLPLRETVEEELNEKFANKVIIDVGLCIVLYDILSIGKSFLHRGDPASSTEGNIWHPAIVTVLFIQRWVCLLIVFAAVAYLLLLLFCFFRAVKFRYVVFRPFIGETLVGKIRSCSREGVHVSLGFFDDILIAPGFLLEPCRL